MKKSILRKLAIGICLLLIMTMALTACDEKTFNLANITRIELTNGTNGNSVSIIEQDQIQALIQPFNNNDFTKSESSKNSTGWSYRLKFFQDDKMTVEIVVMTSGQIDFDGSFYNAKEGTLSIDYYEELLADNLLNGINNIIEKELWIDVNAVDVLHILSGQPTEQTITDTQEVDDLSNWFISLSLTKKQFEDGNSPGDGDGGEVYIFTLLNGNNLTFVYGKYGPDDCYIFYFDEWYQVNNPSDPIIADIPPVIESETPDNNGDIWLQKPSQDPIETVRLAIENQIDKEYTIGVMVRGIVVDEAETERVIEMYSGSMLAQGRGWTNEYLAEHFIVVKAEYYAEYDHTKTPLDDGNIFLFFYLTRDAETGEWTIIDNSGYDVYRPDRPDEKQAESEMPDDFNAEVENIEGKEYTLWEPSDSYSLTLREHIRRCPRL